MYQVIGHPQTRAIRLMWMLEELGEAYEVAPFPPASEAMKRINASGKSPVLGDGKLMIPDSMAGCVYLADKHDRLGYPAGTAERARLDSLMFLILDEIEGPLWTKAKHSFALPEKLRVPEMKAVAEKEFRRGLANLAARLGTGPYLTGENFTYADILLGHCAAWGAVAGFPAPEDEALAGLIERIRARPSLAAAEARRNEILASQKAQGQTRPTYARCDPDPDGRGLYDEPDGQRMLPRQPDHLAGGTTYGSEKWRERKMAEYRLHCFAQSGHSYKAALMLALTGSDWEPVFVDFFNGGVRTDEFRAINEMAECPVLETPDMGNLTQSGVILDYLAGKTGKFQTTNEADRLEVLRWIIWENQKLNGMLGPWRFMLQFAPEKVRNEAVNAFLKGRSLAALSVLESHLAGREWMVGDAPTTADVACSGYIFYPAEEYDYGDASFPNIEAWKARVSALPGWVHPYELMPGHPRP